MVQNFNTLNIIHITSCKTKKDNFCLTFQQNYTICVKCVIKCFIINVYLENFHSNFEAFMNRFFSLKNIL